MTTEHEAALRLMAHWVAAISDQVKNPVAAVMAAKRVLEQQLANANPHDSKALTAEFLDLLTKRLKRLDVFLSELSDFVRPALIEPRWFDIRPVLAECERRVRLASDAGAKLSCTVEDAAHEMFADPDKLGSVLVAVFMNGIESVGVDREPEINVRVSRSAGRTSVVVSDNGVGFPEHVAPRAHEAFFSTKEAGTGLGLAVVDKFVTAHGGSLEFGRSQHLGGAEVRLHFPIPDAVTKMV